MATKKSKSGKARSAIKGQYVTIEYAKKHPTTTVIESTKKSRKK